MYIITSFVFSLSCLLHSIQSQYTHLNKNAQHCDGTSKTALVEHFFNLIFTEFHSTPPVCVCVQMCADQSIYCYPNGCFKHKTKKIIDEPQPVSRIQNDDAREQIFLVEQKNDYVADFIWRKYPEESKTVKADTMSIRDIRPDPFKDKYKTAFRYKKLPQIELKYNLREQIKNTKADLMQSENADISKTRWPLKKHIKRNGHMFPSIHDSSSPVTKNNNFFISVLPDKDVVNYPPRYTKRELKKVDDTKVDTQTIYIVSEANDTVQNTSFSIENLINDLIENNFGSHNGGVEINIGYYNENNETKKAISNKTLEENLQNDITINNVTTDNIQFMNFSGENLDRSKYVNAFNEMIANLLKKIDIQNNTSLEMMRRVSGGIEVAQVDMSNELFETTVDNKTTNEVDNTTTTQEMITIEETTPRIVSENFTSVNVSFPSNDNEGDISKKSRLSVNQNF